MKTHYELLDVAPDAPPDEIKRAFRREIARYHPDKVQHLGREFQQLAAQRAAELTEAYRVLMDEALRAAYDEQVSGGTAPQPQHPAPRPLRRRGRPNRSRPRARRRRRARKLPPSRRPTRGASSRSGSRETTSCARQP